MWIQTKQLGSVLLLRWVRDVGQLVEVIPTFCFTTIDIVVPVADPILLIEAGIIGTDIWDSASVLITHVKDLAVVLSVCVETYSTVIAVKGKCQIWKVLPSLRSMMC